MSKTDELNAGFDAILPTLHTLANRFVPDAFGYRQKVNQAINNDPEVRGYIVQGVGMIIDAVDKERAGEPPAKATAVHELADALAKIMENDK